MSSLKKIALVLLAVVPVMVHAQKASSAAWSNVPLLSFQLTPGAALPDAGADFVRNVGGDLWLSVDYRLPFLRSMFVSGDVGLSYFSAATNAGPADCLLLSVGAGVGYVWTFQKRWDLAVSLKGGIGLPGYSQSSPELAAVLAPTVAYAFGANLSYRLTPSLSLGLDIATRGFGAYYIETAAGIAVTYSLLGSPATVSQPSGGSNRPSAPDKSPPAPAAPAQPDTKPAPLNQGQPTGPVLELYNVELQNVFPIFARYYDDHSVGKAVLRNKEKVPAENIKVSFFVGDYMTDRKPCHAPLRLSPGEQGGVDLFALFNNDVMKITQGTKALAKISIEYTVNGQRRTDEVVQTLRFYDRNAMTWDDNRKAAAFVTAKDTSVLVFSNNVNAMVKGSMNRAVDRNLQTAIAFHDALRLYGVSYVSNPLTPYEVVSKDKLAVDTLKFPRQTFEYRSGDCSDLSILYAALLESVQVETAFITIPGHIFMAFALKADPQEAQAALAQSSDDLIVRDGKVWVPVEVTERDKKFLDAWQEGAKEWRENQSRGQAGFYPLHDAWKTYEPVYYPSADMSLSLPDQKKVVQDFQDDVTRFVELQIFARKAELQAAAARSKQDPKPVNSLGVLYARYDLQESAEREFQRVLAKTEYLPSLINLGNLSYLRQDWDKALAYYNRASRIAPQDAKVLLGIARVNQELENYGQVKKSYDALKQVDPDLASKFAYLDLKGEASTRAAEISGVKQDMVWYEK
jgi:tetratricopeptide (TPR) repeat protein